MNGKHTGCHAFFLHRGHFSFGHFGITALVDKGFQLRIVLRSLLCQRMTRRYRQIRDTHKGIRAGGVDTQFFGAVRDIKGDFHPFGTADPVALHGFDLLRPVFQRIQIIEEFFGISGDFDKPLRDLFALNRGITTPAAAVDNLFVGKNRQVMRTPVHGGSFLIRQTFFIQFGEEPLFPAVIFRRTGGDFAIPVVRETQLFKLLFHVFDIGIGPRCRCGIVFYRRAFRRQTERIPANRL